jgi:hypothetical protein
MAAPIMLSLSGPGFDLPEFSLWGLTVTLSPIEGSSQLERDINGNLVDLSSPQHRKYRVTISCTDNESPGFAAISSEADGIWPGMAVTVTLPPQLGSSDAITLDCLVSKPWSESFDELAAENSWTLELEQV